MSAMPPRTGLALDGVRAGYGDTVVLEGISLALAPRRHARGARPQRRRQDDVARHDHGPYHACTAAPSASPARTSRRCRPIGAPRLGIGFVPQEREIFPSLTVEENLTVAARPGPLVARHASTTSFRSLAERRRNRGNQLSGGEQQMLAIGRALMGNPTLLLMDEPLEGLGAGHRRCAARRARPAEARGRSGACSWSSSMRASRSNSPRTQ